MGFVVVCWLLACSMGCGNTSSGDDNIPAQGGGAGSSTGGSAGQAGDDAGKDASGDEADASLGGSAGSSGTGGAAGSSTGGSAGQAISDASSEDGGAGQVGDDATADASDEDAAAAEDVSIDSGPTVICPSCDELLTWDSTQYGHSAYGQVHPGNGWDDSYAWQMLASCPGWSIYEGHEGGIGDTLEIGSCGDGVVLRWAYDSFSSVQLSQGWTGQTDTSLAIGTSYQAFIQAYPDYTANSYLLDATGFASLTYAKGVVVFQDSQLSKLIVW